MARRLLVIAVLVAGAWWTWTRWLPNHDLLKQSGQLQSIINHELDAEGISDKDVNSHLSQEKSRFGLRWVETHRRIYVPSSKVPALINRLEIVTENAGCRVIRRSGDPSGVSLELGKWLFVMQRLEFTSEKIVSPTPLPKYPEVALVIDDVAYDMTAMDRFAALGVPLTFAILPRDRHSKALAEKAKQLNFAVIIHMPMEPLDLADNNPGPSGLYLNMTPDQLRKQFDKNIASVPYIEGLNNHMGSAFTSDSAKMALVMKWLKEKNLFFLDSHTAKTSVGPKEAKAAGVPCLVNETFLDNADEQAAIEKQLDIVLKLALKRKRTIAIGHYRRKYLVQALAHKLPEFRAHNVQLVTLPTFYPKPH